MKSKVIDDGTQKTFALIFEKGDEIVGELTSFAEANNIGGSHFTAIGAFRDVLLGYFDRQKKDYRQIPIEDQVEVLSLIGDIAMNKAKPKVHAHVVVGKADGSAHGGHILRAHVWPTLELILTESPKRLCRVTDEETGLALIDLSAKETSDPSLPRSRTR
jgi:predicted DNA-binding protein with PD1-like motif